MATTTAFITGIGGFVGRHLARACLAQGWAVAGTLRPGEPVPPLPGCMFDVVELTSQESVTACLRARQPDVLFHLAAFAAVGQSWVHPADTYTNNIFAQLNILEGIRAADLTNHTRVLIIGTSDEYGRVEMAENPVRETTPLRPLSPYAVSKVAQDYMGLQYALGYKMHVVRVRPFNHVGPGQGPGFVLPDFARQIADIEAGRHDPVLHIGNLDAARDFTDVRDIVRGYVLAVQHGEPGAVYNICSGQARTIRSVLDMLLAASSATISVELDPERMRPADQPYLVGDCTLFCRHTGWQPTIWFDQTVRDVLDDWRARARS